MINVKNILGKLTDKAGVKDAIHTAIVSVRAGKPISPGARCSLNEFNEAVTNPKGYGIADPFLTSIIKTGEIFQLILGQSEIPNVHHHWDHPTVKFDPPTRDIQLNKYILETAENLGVTYKELMNAAQLLVDKNKKTRYIGSKTQEETEELYDNWEFWSEWANETVYEFENTGSACCPEYDYPGNPFYFE